MIALVKKEWILVVTSAGGMGITQGSVPAVRERAKERGRTRKEKEKDGKKARVEVRQDQVGAKEKDQG